MKKAALTITVILFLALFSAASDSDTLYVTKKDYPMALTLEDLNLYCNSIVNNNAAVYLKLRQEGRAWMSREGVEVYIIGSDGSDKIKIRPNNTNLEIWTLSEAVRKKEVSE
ncbi:MAG: hypothetical protein JSV47_09540 [Deltaproteobacteria bacterium]|nr:MAG: hypothetical protein JSV47_09540 [Deltaproteobacteria bacterium]